MTIYKVTIYKDDLSCLIHRAKEDRIISEAVYKLLVNKKTNQFSVIYLKLCSNNGSHYLEVLNKPEYPLFDKSTSINVKDNVFLLDTLVNFSEFITFLKNWLLQYNHLQEYLYDEMPDFLWFFKVFLSTQNENYFEPCLTFDFD